MTQRKKKPSGYRILALPASVTLHKCLQHSSKFSQAKVGSIITLLRSISCKQEDKWSTLLLNPAYVNSSTDTLIHCWERTLTKEHFHYVWNMTRPGWQNILFFSGQSLIWQSATQAKLVWAANKENGLRRKPYREYQKCTRSSFSARKSTANRKNYVQVLVVGLVFPNWWLMEAKSGASGIIK